MAALHEMDCNQADEQLAAMDGTEIEAHLGRLESDWELDDESGAITYTYTFSNYYQTMAFANVIAQVAHQQDHHPTMTIEYKTCTVSFSTHSVGGISIKDFICAAKIDAAQSL